MHGEISRTRRNLNRSQESAHIAVPQPQQFALPSSLQIRREQVLVISGQDELSLFELVVAIEPDCRRGRNRRRRGGRHAPTARRASCFCAVSLLLNYPCIIENGQTNDNTIRAGESRTWAHPRGFRGERQCRPPIPQSNVLAAAGPASCRTAFRYCLHLAGWCGSPDPVHQRRSGSTGHLGQSLQRRQRSAENLSRCFCVICLSE